MKKYNLLYIIGLLGLFIIGLFLIVLIFLKRIESEIFGLMSIYGYFAILIVAFIVDIIAQPMGPEVPLIAARIIGLSMILAALLTLVGSTLASFFSYKIGKMFYSGVCKEKKCTKYLKLYQKYGKYGLLISALGPVPYVPFCWFSGAFGLSIRNFLLFGIFPRIIRIIFVSIMLALFF